MHNSVRVDTGYKTQVLIKAREKEEGLPPGT